MALHKELKSHKNLDRYQSIAYIVTGAEIAH